MVDSQDPYSHPLITSFLERFADSSTNCVRFHSLGEIDAFLTGNGFSLIWTAEYGPPGGHMLFYASAAVCGTSMGMQIRVKTFGNKPSNQHRAYQPHVSITLVKGGIDKKNEIGIYNPTGQLEPPKASDVSAEEREKWGPRTHLCIPGYETVCAKNPKRLEGIERIPNADAVVGLA